MKKTTSVDVGTQTTATLEYSIEDNYTQPTEEECKNNNYFPKGSIVYINGFDLSFNKYKSRSSAPRFYGCVQNPSDHDHEDARYVKESEAYVSFVLAGEFEWYDKNKPNAITGAYPKSLLTLCAFPPGDCSGAGLCSEENFLKLFDKKDGKWNIKIHEDPCYGCGPPWC